MEAKSSSFTIKVLAKQINTREDLDPLCKDLEANLSTVTSVTFTGNSYGLGACTRISQLLEQCKAIKVRIRSIIFV